MLTQKEYGILQKFTQLLNLHITSICQSIFLFVSQFKSCKLILYIKLLASQSSSILQHFTLSIMNIYLYIFIQQVDFPLIKHVSNISSNYIQSTRSFCLILLFFYIDQRLCYAKLLICTILWGFLGQVSGKPFSEVTSGCL